MSSEDCGCTEIDFELVVGDSFDLNFVVKNDAVVPVAIDLSKAIDGTASRPAVLRFAIVKALGDPPAKAVVYKDSYDPAQIFVKTQTAPDIGAVVVRGDSQDTDQAKPKADLPWDLEITRQDFIRTQAGTLTFDGTTTVVGFGTNFLLMKRGDIIHPTSGANSGKPVIVEAVTDALHIVIDRAIYGAEAGVTFEGRRGYRRTSAKGKVTLVEGAVS